jgi:hypothetical protein
MADYYSILEKTISGLPNNSPEVRNAVYKKARSAIETQLRNMDPSPSEEAISSQLKLLEEAILLIDSEHSDQPDPVIVEETVISEPEQVPEPEPEPEETAPQEPLVSSAAVSAASSPESVVERVETAIEQIESEAPASVGLEASSASEVVADRGSISVDPKTKDILEPIISADVASDGSQPETADLEFEEKKSGGFFGGLIKLLVILGLLGGAGYAVWKNKDELTDFANNLMKPADVAEEVQTTSAETEPEEEVTEPEPVEETTEIVTPEPTEPEVVEPEVEEPEVAEPEVVEPEVSEPESETAQEGTDSSSQQSGVIPIGEVAYLYEEGTAGSGATRTNAAITWEMKQESLKEGNAPEPVIVGKMDVPEKAMSIDINIKRNIDEAVSASHMIELRFNLPADFTGKSVESIARFVMKTTEEAPGEPLVAVPVKVSEGYFLIALDNLTQAVAVNTQLLKESAWIDVPIVYGTGKRALITLEKGGTGERVFDEAFKDWQNR